MESILESLTVGEEVQFYLAGGVVSGDIVRLREDMIVLRRDFVTDYQEIHVLRIAIQAIVRTHNKVTL